MKKKKAATNWRKRALEAEKQWCEALADRNVKAISLAGEIRRNADLRGQIEVGDALLDKQRERLIRLTEIKNFALELIHRTGTARRVSSSTFELTGEQWVRVDSTEIRVAALNLAENIAALEVDSFVPQKEKP